MLCFLIFAGTIRRESFYSDLGIVSDVALSPQLITFGALASTAFSALMGVLACAKVLQAIARDNLLPALAAFAQGTEKSDDPTYATLLTWILIQGVLFVDSVNVLAQLTTVSVERRPLDAARLCVLCATLTVVLDVFLDGHASDLRDHQVSIDLLHAALVIDNGQN